MVGIFVLSGLKNIFEAGNVGIGMAVFPNCSGFKVERLKKETHAYFKSLGLEITVGVITGDYGLLRCGV